MRPWSLLLLFMKNAAAGFDDQPVAGLWRPAVQRTLHRTER